MNENVRYNFSPSDLCERVNIVVDNCDLGDEMSFFSM